MVARTDTQGRPAAVVGARLLYPNGCIQHAGVFFSARTRAFWHRCQYGPADLPEALVPVLCPVTGALQLIRHETLATVGLYDEEYRMAYEDVDYCLRVFESGLQCIYEPSVCAVHHESVFRGRSTPKLERWQQESSSGCARSGPRRPDRLHPGDRMTDLPRTIFLGISNGAVAWYRCALPATVLGCTGSASPASRRTRDPRRRRRPRLHVRRRRLAMTSSSSSRSPARRG